MMHDEPIIMWARYVHIVWICVFNHQGTSGPGHLDKHEDILRDIFSSHGGDDHDVLEGVG